MNTKLFKMILTCVFGNFLTAGAFAEIPTELDAYKKIAGKYKCKGQTLGEGAHAFDATFKLEPVSGGAAYLETYEEKKSKAHTSPGKASVLWGYDKATGKYSRQGVDASGGWGSAQSTGFDDKGLFVWNLAGDTTKIGLMPKGSAVDIHVDVSQNGTWATVANLKCNK